MTCIECEKIKQRKNVIYEDELSIALLNDNPATAGHIVLHPKQHQVIIEQLSDDLIEHLFMVANKLSISCFESLGAQGTNILINNGVAAGQKTSHVTVNIIPRVENDGLSMHWQPIKMSDEDLNTAQLMIKNDLERKEEVKEVKEPVKEEVIEEGEDNYLLKQLERIP